jgi:hypothetical protein
VFWFLPLYAVVGGFVGGLLGLLSAYWAPKWYASRVVMEARVPGEVPELRETSAEWAVEELDLELLWEIDESEAVERVMGYCQALPGDRPEHFIIEVRASSPSDARRIAAAMAEAELDSAPVAQAREARQLAETRDLIRQEISNLEEQLRARPELDPMSTVEELQAAVEEPKSLRRSLAEWRRELRWVEEKLPEIQEAVAKYDATSPAPAISIVEPPLETWSPVSPDLDRRQGVGRAAGVLLGLLLWWRISPRVSAEPRELEQLPAY